jgi:hypothetical protein
MNFVFTLLSFQYDMWTTPATDEERHAMSPEYMLRHARGYSYDECHEFLVAGFGYDPMLDFNGMVLPFYSPACSEATEFVQIWAQGQVEHYTNGGDDFGALSCKWWIFDLGALRYASETAALQIVFSAAGIQDWHTIETMAEKHTSTGSYRGHYLMVPHLVRILRHLQRMPS